MKSIITFLQNPFILFNNQYGIKQKLFSFLLLLAAFSSFGQEVKLVKDLNSTTNKDLDFNPANLTVYNNKVYFSADDGTNGIELWESDGTKAGTKLVKDINTGGGSSSPKEFKVYNNKLYFSANDGTNGAELWESDGTEAGTTLVKDILTGSGSSSPQKLIIYNSKLYFYTSDAQVTLQLWESDGTQAGTNLFRDIDARTSGLNKTAPELSLIVYNNKFYYSSNENGYEFSFSHHIWESDGTQAGTKGLITGTRTSSKQLTVYNNKFYFAGKSDNGDFNTELWESDGTTAGTKLFKDINPGVDRPSVPENFIVYNGKLYFSAHDDTNRRELWESDGTVAGTKLVKDIFPGNVGASRPKNFFIYNNKLYFSANIGSSTVFMETDGTVAGTKESDDFRDDTLTFSLHPTSVAVLNSKAYFAANDGVHGNELWETDGTKAGTNLIGDFNTETIGSSPTNLTVYNNKLYFAANNGTNGIELWESDDTEAGTKLVKDINVGTSSSSPSNLTLYNGKLYFAANDGTNGTELWKSDGTDAGTKLFKDINLTGNSSPSNFVVYNNKLYFSANDGTTGIELWESDGTVAGTVLLKDINGAGNSSPALLTLFNNKIYFRADDGANGTELWESDGTDAGTKLVKDIHTSGSSTPSELAVFNSKLYFAATDGTTGIELWESDGTDAGTKLFKDIRPTNRGRSDSSPQYLTVYNGKLYFAATLLPTNGRELWESDGTEVGTIMLKDIIPARSSSNPSYLTVYNNKLYFTAEGINGIELWESDGTEAGTKLAIDIKAGTSSSSPKYLTVYNNKILFSANKDDNNIELYTFTVFPNVTTTVASSIANTSATLAGTITANGGTNITERGIVFSTSDTTPTIAEAATKDVNGIGIGVFTKSITSFAAGTTYYYNAYAINSTGISYGAATTFTTTGKGWLGTTNTNWAEANNWSPNAIPIASDNLVIPNVTNKPIIESGTIAVANNINIDAIASLTINAGASLTMDGNLIQNGTFIISSTATESGSLLVKGTSNGQMTYERAGLLSNKWSLVTSPVSGQSVKDFVENTANEIRVNTTVTPNRYAVGYYDDSKALGSKWIYYTVDDLATNSITFKAGKSYIISRKIDGFVTFTGTITTNNVNKTVAPSQWNTIGNPFTTYFPINKNSDANFINDNLNNFDPLNTAIYTWDNAQNKYISISLLDNTRFLPPGQGFFVKTKSGVNSILFNEDKRKVHPETGTIIFSKSANNTTNLKLVASSNNISVTTDINYFSTATKGLDPGYDIGNFEGTSFDVYTKLLEGYEDENFTIQSLPNSKYDEMIVFVGLKATANSEVTFSLEALNLPSELKVFLEDKQKNKLVRLDKENAKYTITLKEKLDGIGRFYLHTQSNVLTIEDFELGNNLKIYTSEKNNLRIEGLNVTQDNTSIKIYNILGTEIFKSTFKTKVINDIKIPNLKIGIYTIQLKNSNGKVNKKIILE